MQGVQMASRPHSQREHPTLATPHSQHLSVELQPQVALCERGPLHAMVAVDVDVGRLVLCHQQQVTMATHSVVPVGGVREVAVVEVLPCIQRILGGINII